MVQFVSTGEALMERRIAQVPPGGERLEAGRDHRVRLPGDVVQPAAVGADRYGAVASTTAFLSIREGKGHEPRRTGSPAGASVAGGKRERSTAPGAASAARAGVGSPHPAILAGLGQDGGGGSSD